MHGGSSGIGTTAIQLAEAFGARVVTTAGSEGKVKECLGLGADRAGNYRSEDFVAATRAATDGKGADVVLTWSAAITSRAITLGGCRRPHRADRVPARTEGRIDLHVVMAKRLTHTGSTLRPRSAAEKAMIADALHARVWPLLEQGRCKPIVDSLFPARRGG